MQTFMPFETFEASAFCLDWRRLGKQRLEARDILRVLLGEKKGWRNHPAVKMWAGYEEALCLYGKAVCKVWRARGYRDAQLPIFESYLREVRGSTYNFPLWMENHEFHRSHQSNLVRKDPEYYGKLFPNVPSDLPYVWPAGMYVPVWT